MNENLNNEKNILYKVWRTKRIIYEFSFITNFIIVIWLWTNNFKIASLICLFLFILEIVSGSLRINEIEKRLV